jgi:hypothetical protein
MSTLNNNQNGETKTMLNKNRSTLDPEDKFLVQRNGVTHTIKAEDVGSDRGGGVDTPPPDLPGSSISLSPASLSSDGGKIEFSIDSGTTWSSSVTTDVGSIVNVRWTADAFDDVAHGDTASETLHYQIINGALYDQTYTYDVDKVPEAFNFADRIDTGLSEAVASPTVVTLAGVNAKARVWATTDSTSVEARINGGSWTALQSTPDNTVLITNGETLEIRHTTSPNILEVRTSTIYVGWDAVSSVNDTYTTTNTDAGVVTPTITFPTEGSTEVSVSSTIASSTFSGIGPTNTHVSSDWQLATDVGFTSIVLESIGDTTNKTTWAVNLEGETTYYVRVCYNGSPPSVVSDYSTPVSFTSGPAIVTGYITGMSGGWVFCPETLRFYGIYDYGDAGNNQRYYRDKLFDLANNTLVKYRNVNWTGAGCTAGVHKDAAIKKFQPIPGTKYVQSGFNKYSEILVLDTTTGDRLNINYPKAGGGGGDTDWYYVQSSSDTIWASEQKYIKQLGYNNSNGGAIAVYAFDTSTMTIGSFLYQNGVSGPNGSKAFFSRGGTPTIRSDGNNAPFQAHGTSGSSKYIVRPSNGRIVSPSLYKPDQENLYGSYSLYGTDNFWQLACWDRNMTRRWNKNFSLYLGNSSAATRYTFSWGEVMNGTRVLVTFAGYTDGNGNRGASYVLLLDSSNGNIVSSAAFPDQHAGQNDQTCADVGDDHLGFVVQGKIFICKNDFSDISTLPGYETAVQGTSGRVFNVSNGNWYDSTGWNSSDSSYTANIPEPATQQIISTTGGLQTCDRSDEDVTFTPATTRSVEPFEVYFEDVSIAEAEPVSFTATVRQAVEVTEGGPYELDCTGDGVSQTVYDTEAVAKLASWTNTAHECIYTDVTDPAQPTTTYWKPAYPRTIGVPMCVGNSYPLFYTAVEATTISPTNSYVTLQVKNVDQTYYFPLGISGALIDFSTVASAKIGNTNTDYVLNDAQGPQVVSLT